MVGSWTGSPEVWVASSLSVTPARAPDTGSSEPSRVSARTSPRSIMSALRTAERCLEDLAAAGPRVGFGDEAQRLLGRARADLEYRPLAAILTDLPEEMEQLQVTCSAAAEAIGTKYFDTSEAIHWAGGLG